MKILKRKENYEKANPLLQESDFSFQEDCRFHLALTEQNNSLQLRWCKHLHWCQDRDTFISWNKIA